MRFDVPGDPFCRRAPSISIANQRAATSAECGAAIGITQQFPESVCQLLDIVRIDQIPRPAILDEIRNRADVGRDDG